MSEKDITSSPCKIALNDHLPAVLLEHEGTDLFSFESESYALQNNKDYQLLLKTLIQLESQKIRAIKDLEELHEARQLVLKDPLAFVKCLQNGENLKLPGSLDIVEVPEMDWEKYNIQSIIQTFRPTTRRVTKTSTSATEGLENEVCSDEEASDAKLSEKSERLRSETFNKPWSADEQRKLEELLIKYPDEHMSSKRWAKISKELGTRTLMQVQSRVQKYFIALKKEGLPIPGKNPRKMYFKATKRRNNGGSFMRAFDFEADKFSQDLCKTSTSSAALRQEYAGVDISDEEDICEDLRDTKTYRDLMLLKRAKKLKQMEMNAGQILHHGYTCDGCGLSPIAGIRWHCTECAQVPSVDFCSACSHQYKNDSHSATHILQPIRSFCIKDSCSFR